MRKFAVIFAVSMVLPVGVLVSSASSAAAGTTCKAGKGTAKFAPSLPITTKAKSKLTATETLTSCIGGGVTSGKVTLSAVPASLSGEAPLNCTTLFTSATTVMGGTETITWNTKKTSTVSIGIHGDPKAPHGLTLTVAGNVTAGLFEGQHWTQGLTFTPVPAGGCTKTPMGATTVKSSKSNTSFKNGTTTTTTSTSTTSTSTTSTPTTLAPTKTTIKPESLSILSDGGVAIDATVTSSAVFPHDKIAGVVIFYYCGPFKTPTSCNTSTPGAKKLGTTYDLGNDTDTYSEISSFRTTSLGYWCFGVYYLGNATHAASSDTSTAGCVNFTNTQTTSKPGSPSIVLGHSNSDMTTVSSTVLFSAADEGGLVETYLCGPYTSPTSCSSAGVHVGGAQKLGSADYQYTIGVATVLPTSAGYWCFASYYLGNPDHLASSDTSTDECFQVTP